MGSKAIAENKKLNVPGPGVYDIPNKLVESPGKSMGKRLNI